MGDVIQTVVEEGRKIAPRIVWDNKMSDKVTPSDILKAKNYKTKHNTDYSIIVTKKGITWNSKNSKNDSNNPYFGEREGIKLVHPDAAIDMAKIFRSFIIENAKQTNSNKNRTSKQSKLYEYLKSSEYARGIEAERRVEFEEKELLRKEKNHHEDIWNARTKNIDRLRNLREVNQKKISDILQDPISEDSEDDLNREGEDSSSS